MIERDIKEARTEGPAPSDWARNGFFRPVPTDLLVMAGSEGQRVYISPSHHLVIVRLGRGPGFHDQEFFQAYFRPAKS